MRFYYLVIGLFFISISAFGQEDEILKGLLKEHDKIDCELISLNAVDYIVEKFDTNPDSSNLILSKWVESCGLSECSQRMIVLLSIMNNEDSNNKTEQYFSNNLHKKFRNRIKDSKEYDFGYLYSRNKSYYEFVPLRHKYDSLVREKALELLTQDRLTPDEELVCLLFSGQLELFDKKITNKEYKDSYVRNYMRKQSFKQHDSWLAYTIYTGVHGPLGNSNNVFSLSPMLGLTFSTPMENKLVGELGIKFTFHSKDKEFLYYAEGDTNIVDSDIGFFFGGLLGYKIYEKDDYVIMPKLGIGLGMIDTDLPEDDSDDDYYDIETIHLSAGISAMKAIMRKSYIGIAFNVHYIPYNSDKDLITKINSNSYSIELFLRF